MSLDSRSRSGAYKAKRDRHIKDDEDDDYDRRLHREDRRQQGDRDRYDSDRRRYNKDDSYRRSRRRRSRSRSSSYEAAAATKRRHNSRSRYSRSSSRTRKHRKSPVQRHDSYRKTVRASRSRSMTPKTASRSPPPPPPPILSTSLSTQQTLRSVTYDHSSSSSWSSRNQHTDLFKNIKSSGTITIGDDEHFDKEKIHKEMQERLAQHLAREGKVYPPPKPQASHPIFANDGSFLETFKKMQEQQKSMEHHHHHMQQMHHHHQQQQQQHQQQQQQQHQQHLMKQQQINDKRFAAIIPQPQQPQQPQQQPMFGKRRGGKILKTGIVEKPKNIEEPTVDETPNDTWAIYLQEVKKYKNVSCDADSKTRPLVK